MKKIYLPLVAAAMLLGVAGTAAADTTVTAAPVNTAPVLDGNASDWSGVTATTIKVDPAQPDDQKNHTGSIDVQVKAATNGDMLYWLVQWPDDSKNDTHKSLTWNKEKDGYDTGKDREDRLALKFDMGGDFNFCMLSGKEYKADVWQWKAFRSGSVGLAHDKMHIMSYAKMPKAKMHKARNGKEIWIARPSDKGDKLYKSQRPLDNIGDVVPKYLVNKNCKGSIADVKAAAKWSNNMWTLELSRKLDTGHDDDVKFAKGKSYKAGMAVFNQAGDDHHSVAPFTLAVK